MKKLMIALAVAAVAAIGNAASVNWGAGTVTEPGGATANKSVTGYLFVLTADQYSALNTAYGSATGSSAGEKMANTVWNAYGDKLDSAYATGTTTKKGLLTLTDDSKSYGAGDAAYAALIYTYGSGDDLKYIGNIGTVTLEGAMDAEGTDMAVNLFGSTTAGSTAWTAAAVPEPTSGLLMLLGMAGLALRRRRA